MTKIHFSGILSLTVPVLVQLNIIIYLFIWTESNIKKYLLQKNLIGIQTSTGTRYILSRGLKNMLLSSEAIQNPAKIRFKIFA